MLTASGGVFATASTTLTATTTLIGRIQGASALIFDGATANDANYAIFAITDPTAVRTITFPNTTGTVALTGLTFPTTNGDMVLTTASSTGAVKVHTLQISAGGTPVTNHISVASSSVDFVSIATSTCTEQTETSSGLTGAATGDIVIATPATGIESGLTWNSWVPAANQVTIRICNVGGTDPLNPAARAWRITVIKY